MAKFKDLFTLKRSLNFFKRIVISTVLVSTFFVLTQDFQIFPGALAAFFSSSPLVPDDVQETKVTTRDGETVSVWRVQAKGTPRRQVILLFHGNAESLSSIVSIQRWFASLGFTSYAVEYRGYAGNTGFPSEQGIYLDSEAAMDLLVKNENITAQDVVIFGNSIGSGPAAYTAQKYGVGTLVLVAPYTSLTDIVRDLPFFGYLHPFLWYRFPVQEYTAKLTNTCVVAAHGKLDSTIDYHHSEELNRSYRGTRSYTLILSDGAGHNDIFGAVSDDIAKALDACLLE